MAGAFFYVPVYREGQAEVVLDEDNSRHIVQVLRMKAGDPLQLTDGRGHLLKARIVDGHKKKALVAVEEVISIARGDKKVSIALSLLKNAHRFEWFLEKAMEIGVAEIIPLICERTEKQHFRQERMQSILVSAMLQSQQLWLPGLWAPTPFAQVVGEGRGGRKLIAHCGEERGRLLGELIGRGATATSGGGGDETLILIGPEGDFSQQEVGLALERGFEAVSLGETRLRAETAGVVVASLLCVG